MTATEFFGTSRISVGNRVEIETCQLEQNDRSKSLLVTKPAGRLPQGFDLRVDASGCGVGEPMLEVAHDPKRWVSKALATFLTGWTLL